MLGGVLVAAHGDGGIGVGAAVGVDQQGIALGVVLAAFEVFGNVDLAAIGAAASADADGFADDVGSRLIGGVDHLGAGVLVLAIVGEGDADDFAAGAFALHDHAGIFHRQAAADVAVDPFHFRILMGDAAFGDEIEHVVGPILDGDVLDLGALHGHQFHDRTVEGAGGELRRGAAFHVHHFRAFIHDDEGALELAKVFGVDAEVGLQRVFHLHALRHVDEGPAGKDCAVEGGELVVAGGDDFAEPRTENLRVFLQAFGTVDENHALIGDRFLNVGIGGFAVKLRFHPGEEFAFLLGNAEAFEGHLHLLRHIIPRPGGGGAAAEVITDLAEVDILEVLGGPVGRHGLVPKDFEGALPEITHPVRVVLHIRDVIDGRLAEADAGVELVIFRIRKITGGAVDIDRLHGGGVEIGVRGKGGVHGGWNLR